MPSAIFVPGHILLLMGESARTPHPHSLSLISSSEIYAGRFKKDTTSSSLHSSFATILVFRTLNPSSRRSFPLSPHTVTSSFPSASTRHALISPQTTAIAFINSPTGTSSPHCSTQTVSFFSYFNSFFPVFFSAVASFLLLLPPPLLPPAASPPASCSRLPSASLPPLSPPFPPSLLSPPASSSILLPPCLPPASSFFLPTSSTSCSAPFSVLPACHPPALISAGGFAEARPRTILTHTDKKLDTEKKRKKKKKEERKKREKRRRKKENMCLSNTSYKSHSKTLGGVFMVVWP